MAFRYDINILRVLAILGVIFFHFQVPYFTGGFAGVDVFFVISGYLMSRIIINAIDSDKFSFLNFYWRRAKRILPALLFVIVTFTVLNFFFYFPKDYRLNEQYAASSILFLSNFIYWQNSNYFEQNTDNLFLHTWSLSVEWQFYLLYPIGLFFLLKLIKNKKHLLYVFLLITVIIFFCSIAFSENHNHAAFYLLPTRSWEMMLGGIAYLSEGFFKKLRFKKEIAFLGYLLIVFSFLWLDNTMLWPGMLTAIPVVATFLVIISNQDDFVLFKNKALQLTGNISYSLYLWHWPVYAFAVYFGLQINALSTVALILVSAVLAFVSFKYIEPARFNDGKKRVVIIAAVVFLGCSGLGFFDANQFMFKPKALKLSDYAADHKDEIYKRLREGVCFITGDGEAGGLNKTVCLSIENNKKNVLLIGDSHAAHLYSSLQEGLKVHNVNILEASASSCFPVANPDGDDHCEDMMKYVYDDFIKNNSAQIDGVILSCNWIEHITDKDDDEWKELMSAIDYYKSKNIKVLIIGQTERYDIPYPTLAAKEYQYGIAVHGRYVSKPTLTVNLFLKENLKPYYVDIYNSDLIPLSMKGDPYMFDENHFTKYGADIAVSKILANPITKQFISTMGK